MKSISRLRNSRQTFISPVKFRMSIFRVAALAPESAPNGTRELNARSLIEVFDSGKMAMMQLHNCKLPNASQM